MKLIVKTGRTSLLVRVFIQDSSSTTGAGLTGLVFNTTSLVCYRARDDDGNAGATAITLATATKGTWATGGFVEKDATNMPGWYEFGVPNAALATGSETVDIELKGATNMAPCVLEIQLVAYDPQSTGLGLSNVSANMVEVNGHAVTDTASGVLDVNAKNLGGTAQTGRDVGASVLLSAGTGTGQLDFTSGVVKANLAQILGTALTETAGQIAAGFKKFFNVATPAMDVTSVNQTGDSYARLGAPAGASIEADIAAVKTDTAAVKVQTDKLTFTVAGIVDANVKDWAGTAVASTNTAGVPVVDTRQVVRQATAQATGNSTTAIKLDASASATDGFYKGMRCQIISGTGAPEYALITAYVGATKIATVSPAWPTAPDSTSVFQVLAVGMADVETWLGATAPANTGDAFARLGAPAGASIAADLAEIEVETDGIAAIPTTDNSASITAIKAQTDKLAFTVANQIDANVIDWKSTAAPAMTGDAFARLGAAGAGLTALGDTRLAHLDADVSSRLATSGYTVPPTVAQILTTAMTESYAAQGAAPTLAQALFQIQQKLGDFSISGTTLTVHKLDGLTAAATYTLNDATAPTGLTRAT